MAFDFCWTIARNQGRNRVPVDAIATGITAINGADNGFVGIAPGVGNKVTRGVVLADLIPDFCLIKGNIVVIEHHLSSGGKAIKGVLLFDQGNV